VVMPSRSELERTVYKSARWKRLREAVRERDQMVCQLCFEPVSPDGTSSKGWSVDHIVPLRVAIHLAFEPSNVRLTCRSCNSSRRAKAGRVYQPPRRW